MSVMSRSVPLLALALSCAATLSCKQHPVVPVEKATVVTAGAGPGLRRTSGHVESEWTIHRGDVLIHRGERFVLQWSGNVEGNTISRTGATLAVGRTPIDLTYYVFASDMGEDSRVAQTGFLCARMGNPAWFGATCDQALVRRVTTGGATVGFVSCDQPTCPLVLAGPAGVFVTHVEGLSDVRSMRFGRWDVLLVSTQWTREEGHTGNSVVVMLATAGLRRLAEIPVVDIDTRTEGQIRNQLASWSVTPDGVRVVGERTVIDRASGKPIESIAVDDTWFITDSGDIRRHSTAHLD